MKRSIPRPLVASLLLAPSLAQVPDLAYFADRVGSHYWGPLADSDFGELVVGDFDGDGVLDGVVMDGGVPTFLDAPEAFLTCVHTPTSGDDLAVLVGGSPDGFDSLLLADASGLTEYWRTTGKAWGSGAVPGGVAGLTALAVGDLDGDGGQDVIGVDGASSDVAVLLDDGAGGFTPASFSTAGSTYDVLVLDWTGDGRDEIAVLTDLGLGVYDREFDLVYAWSWSGPPVLAAALDEPGVGAGLAVLVTNATGTFQWLSVFTQVGSVGPYPLGNLGVVAMDGGDLDGDSDADLVLGVTSAASVYRLENLGATGAPQFDPAGAMEEIAVGDQARDPALNHAGLALGDFDRDGDLDLLVPIQGDATSETPSPAEIPSMVTVVPNRDILAGPMQASPAAFQLGDVDGALRITVDLSPPTVQLPFTPPETLALEISVWHTPDFGVPTSTVPFERQVPVTATAFSFPTGQAYAFPPTFPDLYSMVIRQVVRDAQGEVRAIGPALTAIYGTTMQMSELGSLMGSGKWVDPKDNSTGGGGIDPGPGVPPFDEDEVPEDEP